MRRRITSLRYRTAGGEQGVMQPGSHGRVLHNLLGITRKREMDVAEYETLVAVQEKYLGCVGPDTQMTADLLCQMHRDWLGKLYAWAGCYRTVELAKGKFKWPPAYLVEQNMKVFERETLIRFTPCWPDAATDISHALAVVHAELLLIHPFREGNGRLARWLADLMAAQAGLYLPKYQFTGRGAQASRAEYLEAVQRGYAGDYRALETFFARALERGRGA
jgi:cell filamentation protein